MSKNKTDVRYWKEKVFTRTNDEYQVQIAYAGRRERFPLKLTNKDDAALKAKNIYLSLVANGWDKTVAEFKPWTVEAAEMTKRAEIVTVGEFIKEVKAIAPVRPTTFLSYERKFRFLVSQVMGVDGTKDRHDYVHKGFEKWRAKIDAVRLSSITPQAVTKWRVSYISEAGENPLKANSARHSAASIIRCAKALFSKKLLRHLTVKLPATLPFDGVDLGKRPRTRYQSKVNAALVVKLAHEQLKEAKPEQFKIFLLAIALGLRRCEIDKLTWKQFNWETATIRIETTEHGAVKTDGSQEEIDVPTDLMTYFKGEFAKSKSAFVVTPCAVSTKPKHWNHYQCDGHFKDMIEWLRKSGVESRTPIHTLRKEFGSLINQKFGIYAASTALRHSSITVTREHYVDKKERIALDLGELMGKVTRLPHDGEQAQG
jgi:integrase